MIAKICLLGVTLATLSACALLQPFGRDDGGFGESRSVQNQDPYWRRFYQLEQEIAQLKESNRRLSQRIAVPGVAGAGEPVVQDFAAATSSSALADDMIARIRSQADTAISAIDRAISSLEISSPVVAPTAVPAETLRAKVSVPTINGSLIRDEDGQIVRQTTYSEARRHRYNYSVVYVYPEPRPWNAMWDKLEAANENDKWRGFNPGKTSYFIYVGAYYSQLDAQQRQEALFSVVGESPSVRERAQASALAAK